MERASGASGAFLVPDVRSRTPPNLSRSRIKKIQKMRRNQFACLEAMNRKINVTRGRFNSPSQYSASGKRHGALMYSHVSSDLTRAV